MSIYLNGQIVSGGGIPIGTFYSLNSTENYVPDGSLLCDGTQYSKEQFTDFWDNYLKSETETVINENVLNINNNIMKNGVISNFNSPISFNFDTNTVKVWIGVKTSDDVTTMQFVCSNGSTVIWIQDGAFFSNNGDLTTVLPNTEYSFQLDVVNNFIEIVNVDIICTIRDIDLITNNIEFGVGSYDGLNYSGTFLGEIILTTETYGYITTEAMGNTFYTETIYTPKLNICTYDEYEQEITANGNCAKFGVDTESEKFKVPTLISEKGSVFVSVANGTINESQMDWSAWQSSLEGKANKTDIPDLTNYVKNTDYATSSKHGIIKVDLATGINADGTGKAYIAKATDSLVTAKTNNYRPLTPSNIDLAVKTGITTNTIELTDEEKTSANNWLGISDKYATKEDLKNNALNYNQITNCLLEVPQNIKLQLSNGVVTLKAGSVITFPNGDDVFEEITLTQDKTFTYTGSTTNKDAMLFVSKSSLDLSLQQTDLCTSGTTAPTGTEMFYNIDENKIRFYSSGTASNDYFSLPICLCTFDTEFGGIASIDKVFNGMGYIGSTVWVDKGVKGLVANGRNANGTYNNLEKTRNDIVITTLSGTNDISMFMNFDSNSLDYVERHTVEYTSNPTATCRRYYNEDENYWYSHESKSIVPYINIINLTLTNDKISNFEAMEPFKAVDYNKVKDLLDVRKQKVYKCPDTSGVINIGGDPGRNLYHVEVTGMTTIELANQPGFSTFELALKMTTAQSIIFPSTIKWLDDEAPDLSESGIYYLVFRYDSILGNWYANLQGMWSL